MTVISEVLPDRFLTESKIQNNDNAVAHYIGVVGRG